MLSGVADPTIDDGWEKVSLQMNHYYFDTQKKSTFRHSQSLTIVLDHSTYKLNPNSHSLHLIICKISE